MPERASVRRARRSAGWSLVCAVGVNLAIALAPGAALAQAAVQGGRATLRWTPSSGPVAGYLVSVARNGGALLPVATVTQNEVTLTGVPGDLVVVSVRAYAPPSTPGGAYVWSASSQSSQPIRFESPGIPTAGLAIFGCAGCSSIQLRAFPTGQLLSQLAAPTGGSWSLVQLGRFGSNGTLQALFREQTTGALWIGDITGGSLVPHASYYQSGFAQRIARRPADFDRNGVEEILLQDLVSGAVEIWGLVGGAFQRYARFTTDPTWRLIGAADFDADGQADLWLQTGDGLAIRRTSSFASLGTLRLPLLLPGHQAFDLADYDGDGRSDVLWRDPNGGLVLSLLRGSPAAATFEIRALEVRDDDFGAVPVASLDLDDVPGAEIVLQHTNTGNIDVLFPADAIPGQRRVRLVESAAGSWLAQLLR